MKWNVTRSVNHFEYAEVEAETYEEAIDAAKELDEHDWETNPNDRYTDEWNYEATEAE